MRLRPTIALTAAGLTIPLALVVLVVDHQARERATTDLLVAHVRAKLEGDGAKLCSESPARFAMPAFAPPFPPPPGAPFPPPFPPPPLNGPPIHVLVYNEQFEPAAPMFPRLDTALIERARSGQTVVRSTMRVPGLILDEVAVRGSDGACAWIVARRPRPPLGPDTLGAIARTWAPPIVSMFLALAVALGPIVRRIRLLSERVRASARDHYRTTLVLPEGSNRSRDEIDELAHAFDTAGREVRAHLEAQERREQTLREFLANTTHDVMTPLTVLQGHLAGMREHLADGRAVDATVVSAAIDEAHYMASLVHNLGVAARLEAGEPHVARADVDLGALVSRIVSRHRIVARQHTIELEHIVPEEKVIIEGDETFLEQMVSNVVYNAIRHNEKGGHVAVLLERFATDRTDRTDRFRLRVLDDGPGVSSDELASVLERSVRGGAARTRNPDGHGLGLAITKKVAELHGIELKLTRVEPRGLQVDLEGEVATRAETT